MRRSHHLAAASALALSFAFSPAHADQGFTAVLAGQAMLPAYTLVQPPADAPATLRVSGRFTATDGRRADKIGSIDSVDFLSDPKAPRRTDVALPVEGQPVQGLSGIKRLPDGRFLTLSDNGFGNKRNSVDAMLMVHVMRPDWKTGGVERVSTVFLSDPDRVIPFSIQNEHTETRYLTGADLDIESIQPIGGSYYIGDEFGPYLIRTDETGKVTGFWETVVDGKPARSPFHHRVNPPSAPGEMKFEVRASRGFESMAASPDGKFLYPMFEGPLWDASAKAWESEDGRQYLRVLEFDVAKEAYTGRFWKYPLEVAGQNLAGDFNMIDATTAVVAERDDFEGDQARACQAEARPDCFNKPALFKRIYKIEMNDANVGAMVRKIAHIDLLDIADPDGKARIGGGNGRFAYSVIGLENVDVVDGEHIVIANDNNFPYSSGRVFGKVDDNEFVLLKAADFLAAK